MLVRPASELPAVVWVAIVGDETELVLSRITGGLAGFANIDLLVASVARRTGEQRYLARV